MSCATSADALLGGGIVGAAGLRIAVRSWLPGVRARFGGSGRDEAADAGADDDAPRVPIGAG